GRIRELLSYISQEHSALIDRGKPLWTCHIIEGIEDNRFAMYFKIHHAMVDGIAGMRLVEKSLSHDPDAKSIVPPWCVQVPRARRLMTPKMIRLNNILRTIKGQLESTPRVAYVHSQTIRKDMGRNPDYVSSFQAPCSILKQRVSSSRLFPAQSFE